MKLKLIFSTFLGLLFVSAGAQDRTTVSATSSEISDNLDLRAVASIFGDSKDLEDFENRLNDPNNQISNLDLNSDNKVDYLRVIETVEGRSHIIVVQSVLGRDVFQDVASIEVERDGNNRVQVQVVGDVYMYGTNYIYEPVYVHTPIIYAHFWRPNYRPYCSTWYWGYYPSFYYAWNPFPIFRYRSHIALHINFGHHYNYVNYRRCAVAYNQYYHRRGNGYERQYPNRSFTSRNSGYANRHELDRTRDIRTAGSTRNNQLASNGTRGNSRSENNRNATMNGATRVNSSRDASSPRANTNSRDVRSNDVGPRVTTSGNGRNSTVGRSNTVGITGTAGSTTRANTSQGNTRTYESTPSRGNSSRDNQMSSQRTNRSNESRGYSAGQSQQRMPSAGQSNGSSRGGESRGNQGGAQSRGGGQSRGSGRG